jgi:hypothetical protein
MAPLLLLADMSFFHINMDGVQLSFVPEALPLAIGVAKSVEEVENRIVHFVTVPDSVQLNEG